MMGINAAWNVAFISGDLRLAFLALVAYDTVALAVLLLLMRVDRRAA